jgi:hypothetical protein
MDGKQHQVPFYPEADNLISILNEQAGISHDVSACCLKSIDYANFTRYFVHNPGRHAKRAGSNQTDSDKPQFGFRMHDDTYSAAKHGGGRRVLASPTAGIFIHFGKSPVSLGWQTDINGQMSVPTLDSTDYAIWFLNETWISHQVELRYSFEKSISDWVHTGSGVRGILIT